MWRFSRCTHRFPRIRSLRSPLCFRFKSEFLAWNCKVLLNGPFTELGEGNRSFMFQLACIHSPLCQHTRSLPDFFIRKSEVPISVDSVKCDKVVVVLSEIPQQLLILSLFHKVLAHLGSRFHTAFSIMKRLGNHRFQFKQDRQLQHVSDPFVHLGQGQKPIPIRIHLCKLLISFARLAVPPRQLLVKLRLHKL